MQYNAFRLYQIRSTHVVASSLFALHDTQPRLSESQPRLTAVLQGAVDPVVAVGTLLVSVIWFEGSFNGPYLILMLLVLSLTYPGRLPREPTGAGELIQDIAASWFTIIVLLLCLGWASQTLALFDSR